jgi:hypothetical protein
VSATGGTIAYGLAHWMLTSLVATLILGWVGYRFNKRREAAGHPILRGGFLHSDAYSPSRCSATSASK